jgi:hypothetical protein
VLSSHRRSSVVLAADMGLEQPPELLLEMFRREPPQTMRLMTYYPPCRQRQAGKVIGAHQPDATAPCERRAGPAYQGWQVDHLLTACSSSTYSRYYYLNRRRQQFYCSSINHICFVDFAATQQESPLPVHSSYIYCNFETHENIVFLIKQHPLY